MADKCANPHCDKPKRTGTDWALYCSDKCKSLVVTRKIRGIPLERPVRERRKRRSAKKHPTPNPETQDASKG